MIRNSLYFWPSVLLVVCFAALAAVVLGLIDTYQEESKNRPPKQAATSTLVNGTAVSVFTPKDMKDVQCVLVHGTGVWCKDSKQ